MSQPQSDEPRKTSLAVPFALAAFAITVAVVACDPPGTRTTAPAPEAHAQPQEAETVAQTDSHVFDDTTGGASTAPQYASADAISDPVIGGHIKAAILTDPGMAGSDVSVNADHGVVTLTGTVNSQEQAAIASAHAQREDGVMRVDNHLSPNPE
jgi:hypothetical protein